MRIEIDQKCNMEKEMKNQKNDLETAQKKQMEKLEKELEKKKNDFEIDHSFAFPILFHIFLFVVSDLKTGQKQQKEKFENLLIESESKKKMEKN